jgi:D-glycero-D-manno-heptose 1,7-bisphosphate phosphatase
MRVQLNSTGMEHPLRIRLVFSGMVDSIRTLPGCCYDNWVKNAPINAFPQDLHTVFLDRDGVLNEKMPEGRYVTSWDEFHLLPGVPEAIARLNRAGVRVVVVSNQRGIALGLYTIADVEAIHASLQNLLKTRDAHVDAFYFCPHDKQQCNCRKPLPGMFEQAAAQFPGIAAATSVMIGDSFSDIEFGHRLGMKTVFIEAAPERQKPGAEAAAEMADLRCPSLLRAVEAVLGDRGASSLVSR